MTDVLYAFLPLASFVALAALLLKIGDLSARYLKVGGIALYVLAAVGLLLSGAGWVGYAEGRVTLWDAISGSVILGALPLCVALLVVTPDLLRASVKCVARLFRRPPTDTR